MAGCARVVQCAEAVPTLLQVLFSSVAQVSLLPRSPSPGSRTPAAEGRRGLALDLRRASAGDQ